ncbi:hypothetical protein Tco_0973293 [Tanacetum coccineum]
MTTLAEFMIIFGAENHPPMLEKSMYDSWKSRTELYIENRENGRIILNSVLNCPLVWPTVTQEDGTTRTKKYEEHSVSEKLQVDCDLKATNIVLQGLPLDVYAIVNHHKVAKEIWDRVKLLMQGTKLSLQEKECKMYDKFDKFSFVKDETLYQYYWRFAQLINNMNVINMSMRPVQLLRGSLQQTINLELPLIQETRPQFKTAGLLWEARTKLCWWKDKMARKCHSAKRTRERFYGINPGILDSQGLLITSIPKQCFLSKLRIIRCTLSHSQHAIIPMIDDEETLILDEAPRELPKVSLVNTSLKKLKYHLGKFDTVVKKRITPDAIIEGEWGFKHTKAVFINEIIPFLKTLKDIFNVFDKDLLNELQAKDTTIRKLKEHIKSMRENDKEEKVTQEMDEIETINIELEHRDRHRSAWNCQPSRTEALAKDLSSVFELPHKLK